MGLRLIELIVTREEYDKAREALEESASEDGLTWVSVLEGGKLSVKIIMDMEDTESLTDLVEKKFNLSSNYRVIVHPVEATIPRLPDPEEDHEEDSEAKARKAARLSREELYSRAVDLCRFNRPTATLLVLSTVVAVVGLRLDNEIVTLAAMIIAPLMGPSVALSLATALGDKELAGKAAKAGLKGLGLTVAVALVLGLFLDVDPEAPVVQARTRVSLLMVLLALASGAAGATSFTSASATSLVGVMVAMAMLPPLAASCALLAQGDAWPALQAFTLFLINVISLNLSGVAAFVVQGVQPMRWWEAKRARRMTVKAALVWAALLAGLAVAVVLSEVAKQPR